MVKVIALQCRNLLWSLMDKSSVPATNGVNGHGKPNGPFPLPWEGHRAYMESRPKTFSSSTR